MNTEQSTRDVDWNPTKTLDQLIHDPTVDTAGAYEELLARCPIAHVPANAIPGNKEGKVDYWSVLSFDEVAKAAKSFKTFSSVSHQEGPRVIPLESDPPEHAIYRRALNRFFDPEAIAHHGAEGRPIAAEMIDALVAAGEGDFSTSFAQPFPTRVLCRFLGVPDEDWTIHHEFVMEGEKATGQGLSDDSEGMPEEVIGRIMPYVGKVVAARQQNPGDDLVSGIVQMEVEGRRLEPMECCFLMITFMLAGHITTTSGIGNLVLRLARDRELQDLLRAQPERIPDAVEESLRLDTPQQAMPRRCIERVEIGGQTLEPGDRVLMNWGSANVDPEHWKDPEVFELDREDKRHVAFGRGIHMCIGAPLARMEMRMVAEELLSRTSSFEVAGEIERCVWPRLAVERMPLALRAAA
jgi:cytochrome P450